MRKKHRTFEIFSLSFLDVVSCGFGAIILLLVLIKSSEPRLVQEISQDLSDSAAETRLRIEQLQQESKKLSNTLVSEQKRLEKEREKLEGLEQQLQSLRVLSADAKKTDAAAALIRNELRSARQQLTEEMRRLQQKVKSAVVSDSVIGGVPVDSEYIIFIIDTSGSMQSSAWLLVQQKMKEILSIYPQVKGLQVMNDMGDYMFSQYRGKWIRDTPARRSSILKMLSQWRAFSNSSPVEGVSAAIKQFYSPDKKISIYVFGDDFSRGSIQQVVDTVALVNNSSSGGGRVRIHAVGFPVLFEQPGAEVNIARFSALMRRLAEDNNGSFVGLTNLK